MTAIPTTDRADGGRVPAPGSAHTVPLGQTSWRVWRDVLIRGAGFPAGPIAELSDPALAQRIDATFGPDPAGAPDTAADIDAALQDGIDRQSRLLRRQAADPLFREALAWQNPSVLLAADRLIADGPRNSKFWQSERAVVRYWQRYATKNESIGFFGPAAWGRMDDTGPAIRIQADQELVCRRWTVLEDWAVVAVADAIATDERIVDHLPVWLPTPVQLSGELTVRSGMSRPQPISAAEQAVLTAADGRSTAELAAALVDSGVIREEADLQLTVERLLDKGFLFRGFDIRPTFDASDRLTQQIDRLPPAPRALAAGIWQPIVAAAAQVQDAAGDADAVVAAERRLQELFSASAGRPGERSAGQAYAGRRLCYEDTARGLTFSCGPGLLAPYEQSLDILLQAAHWVCARLGQITAERFDALFDELGDGSGRVRLSDLAFLAQGLLLGSDNVSADLGGEFVRRWEGLLGLDAVDPGAADFTVGSADLAGRVDDYFPLLPLHHRAGLLHSPDLQIIAADLEEIAAGTATAVLGELHAGWPTFDSATTAFAHPDVAGMAPGMWRDGGSPRPRMLFPDQWPRLTGRLSTVLDHPQDVYLSFTPDPARGVSEPNLVRATQAWVCREDGHLVVRHGEQSWPLLEAFSDQLAVHTVDAFKLVASRPHTPRVTVDSLIVSRRTWRTCCRDTGLVDVTGTGKRFIAARRFRGEFGLPDRFFVKLASETKPFYVDLTSTAVTDMFAAMVRAAGLKDPDTALTITEMVPNLDRCWFPDAAGRRYVCEVRLQCVRDEGDDR